MYQIPGFDKPTRRSYPEDCGKTDIAVVERHYNGLRDRASLHIRSPYNGLIARSTSSIAVSLHNSPYLLVHSMLLEEDLSEFSGWDAPQTSHGDGLKPTKARDFNIVGDGDGALCPINSRELGYALVRVRGDVPRMSVPDFTCMDHDGRFADPSRERAASILSGRGRFKHGDVVAHGEHHRGIDGRLMHEVWTASIPGLEGEDMGALVYDHTGKIIYGFLTTDTEKGASIIPAKVIFRDIRRRIDLLSKEKGLTEYRIT